MDVNLFIETPIMNFSHAKTSLLLLAMLGGFATTPWAATMTYETRALGTVNQSATDWGWSSGGTISSNTLITYHFLANCDAEVMLR